jgi:hypothetical protein
VAHRALVAQGGYYVATGLLPFVSRRAFEAVTGPKREWWLVQTVGAIVTVVGGALIAGAVNDRVTPELTAVAAGAALSLAGIDVVYVAKGRIRPTYLADAAVEVALVAGLAADQRRRSIVHAPPTTPAFSKPSRS